jgi:hypothetical protein
VSAHSNAQDRQRAAYPLYHDDGLLDVFAGLGIVFAGLFFAAGMPWLVAVLPTSLGPAWYAAQKALVASRIPSPRAEAVSPKRVGRLLVLLAILGILSLLLGLGAVLGWKLGALPAWLRGRPAALPAIGLGLPTALALALSGALLRIARYYTYAALAAAAFAGSYVADWAAWWPVVIVGGLLAAGGVVSLISFVCQHPTTGP